MSIFNPRIWPHVSRREQKDREKTQILWQKLTGARTGAPAIVKQVTYFGI